PDAAVRALAGGRDAVVNLGEVDLADGPRLFINAIGAGFDADVARRAHGRRGPGTIPYLLGVFEALASHRPRTVTLAGDLDRSVLVTGVVVANGPFYGGGMKIAPGASVTGGSLETVVLGA